MFIRPRIMFAPDAGGTSPGAGAAGTPPPGGVAAGDGATSPAATLPAPQPAFAETLPEDIRGEAAFRDIKDLGGLAKSYLSATRMIGGRPEDLLKVPGPDDAAAWGQLHARLGRPEMPDKYALARPALLDGVAVDEKLQGSYRDAAHKAGLSTRQADALYQ